MKIGSVNLNYNNDVKPVTNTEIVEISNEIGSKLMETFARELNNYKREFCVMDVITLFMNAGLYYTTHAIRNCAMFTTHDQYSIAENTFNIVLDNLEKMTLKDSQSSCH